MLNSPLAPILMCIPEVGSNSFTLVSVPHFIPIIVAVLIKYTSQWNGDSPLNGKLTNLRMSGIFCECNVYLPGPNVSSACPSLKNIASCDSCTISCDSVLKSSPGNFHTNTSFPQSLPSHLITLKMFI